MSTATKCAHPVKDVEVAYETPVKEFRRCKLCGADQQKSKKTGEVTPWHRPKKGRCWGVRMHRGPRVQRRLLVGRQDADDLRPVRAVSGQVVIDDELRELLVHYFEKHWRMCCPEPLDGDVSDCNAAVRLRDTLVARCIVKDAT